MLELHTDKETHIDFKLNIEGNASTPICRFVLKLNSEISLTLLTTVSTGMISLTVPPLKELLQNVASSVDAYLEVIVDNSYYIPWNGNITIIEDVNIEIEPISSTTPRETIEISAILSKMEKAEENEDKEVLKEEVESEIEINEEKVEVVKEDIEEIKEDIEEIKEIKEIKKDIEKTKPVEKAIDSKEEVIKIKEEITITKEYIVEGFVLSKGTKIKILE